MRKYNSFDCNLTKQVDPAISWSVNDFALVESQPVNLQSGESGVNYQVIEKYPLS